MPSSEGASRYFERIWESAGDAAPEHFALRRDFLLAAVAPGSRVLDLGCGSGDFSAALADHAAIPVGVDVAAEPLRRARLRYPEIDFILAREERLPFDGGEFDAVWAGEVLEHVQDGLGLLADVARVLRPGGRLVLTTPAHGRLLRLSLGLSVRRFERHFEPRSDHVRFFTTRTLAALLEAADFAEHEIQARRGVLCATATPRAR